MKKGSSLDDKMIDKNWAPKRKRKRKLSRLEESTKKQESPLLGEFEKNSLSLRKKLKENLDASPKSEGHDGYYFVCEECNAGGNLLSCDSCPRAFHLDCLIVPLKHAPLGKWQCPKCCSDKEDKTLIAIQSSSRPVSSERKIRGAKDTHSISSRSIASHSKKSSLGINKSTGKGEDIFSAGSTAFSMKTSSCHANLSSTKSKHSGHSVLFHGVSAIESDQKMKSADTCPQRNITERKKIGSIVKSSTFSARNKLSKDEPDAYINESHDDKLDLSVALSPSMLKKNRKMICRIKKRKRTKSNNVKHAEYISNEISRDGSPCPESSESPPKCSSTDYQNQVSKTKREARLLRSPMKKQLETPHVTSSLSLDDGLGESAEHKMSCDENLSGEIQQVDRILGCRAKSLSSHIDQTNGSATSQAENKAECNSKRLKSKFTFSDLSSKENHDQVDDCYDDGRVIDMKLSECTFDEGHRDAANFVVQNYAGDSSYELDGDAKGKAVAMSECMGKTKINGSTVSQFSLANCLSNEVVALPEISVNGDVINARVSKSGSEGSMVVKELLEICNDNHSPVTCELQNIHLKSAVSKSDRCVENVTVNRAVSASTSVKNDAVIYEFLVKWVGKSNVHNSWVSEGQLKLLAKRKLENYKAKYGTAIINICEDQWCQPQRIISLNESAAGGEALVKWNGLPYDECTWEKVDDSVVQNSCYLISEFKRFETQALDNDARNELTKNEFHDVVSLLEQPNELKGGLLFPHQLEALNWLRRCWHKSKNVILADEMGLGKTVSACSFISSLYIEFKVKSPCLVLVPLSTMPNWLAEFASWAPHLNVVEYHGCAKARSTIRLHEWHASVSRSHKKTKSYKFNVLLTTYEMILADSFHLRGVPWELLVVDEGHRLKNSESKLFCLLNSFSFQHRVLLTGTPLQNNIGEMYNLLNFLQPASFPSLSAFEEKFNDLTTAEKVEELKKLVAPHMLRRLKKDAMQNIPPKTERMIPVELTSIQAEYYRAMLTKNYQLLRNIGKGVAQQSMLNIVMQLRKVCNHPYLIPGTEPDAGSVEFLQEMRIKASAKLTLLHSMLKILRKDGHRVLIFSQMTKLLDILEDYLTVEFGQGTFERVDGSVSVTDRQAAIARFNKDKTRFVFLLSTRSCGLGINLATADTVVIYDSDFNPHADIQAMNRAHRIGQSNRLLVYRLVVRASVEERILQLAKKKLMLDQLFVNKSGSQKEVEDILRWGTEELFGDCDSANDQDSKDNSNSKVDTTTYVARKHRRRVGGLGDVYKDRCTDGSTKIIWDENAILKLLDRSDLQASFTDNIDGDLDGDLLGSVKSLDWSDEHLNGQQGGSEMIADLAGDGCDPYETKEDNANTVTEENQWDRLLRDRWEKYQFEEEAALGRGKRLRKAVSYRETLTSVLNEALNENVNEEPEREYSLAGRALKEKYMKLRARQKDRIARRHAVEVHSSAEAPESLIQSPISDIKEVQHSDSMAHSEDSSEFDPMTTPYNSTFDSKNSCHSTSKHGRISKLRYKQCHGSHLNISVRPPSDSISSGDHTGPANYVSSSALPPVLGLCAPNACSRNSTSQRKFTTRTFNSLLQQPSSNHEQGASISMQEFPFAPFVSGGPSIDTNVAGQEPKDSPILFDKPEEALHCLKNIIPDSYFPFGPPLVPGFGKLSSDPSGSVGTSLSSFREKLGLLGLVSDEVPLKFPIPSSRSMKLRTDFLPNLSLSSNMEFGNGSGKEKPNMPLMPSFGRRLTEAVKQKQLVPELSPVLNPSLLRTGSSIPENHLKVLENLVFKTQNDVHKFMKKRLKLDAWLEDELDALWIGVRRHGKGNWEAILHDPKLRILKNRSVEELQSKWNEEQHKIMEGPLPPPKTASFLGLSDAMMARALHGSKFASFRTELPKFHSHLTDIQLGSGNNMSSFSSIEPSSQLGVTCESHSPLLFCPDGRLELSCNENIYAGPVDKFEKTNLPLEPTFHQSPPLGRAGSLGINLSSDCSPHQTDDISARSKQMKLPSLLEKSLSLLRETRNIHSVHSDGTCRGVLRDAKLMATSNSLIENEIFPGGPKDNKLPHWLREAVSSARPTEAVLPPSISAILHSVRVLYGEDRFTIPPFLISKPLPMLPKDPRKILRKKRKLNRVQQVSLEKLILIGNADTAASCSIPDKSPLMRYSVPLAHPIMQSTIPPVPPLMPNIISSASLMPSISPAPSLASYKISSASSLVSCPITVMPSLTPSFGISALPLMAVSLPPITLMMPFKFPSALPMMSSSIHQSPTMMQSSIPSPIALPVYSLPALTLLPSSVSPGPSMFCAVPPLSPLMQCSIPTEPPLMPCTISLSEQMTESLPDFPRKEAGFMLPSLNLNLNLPSSPSYSAQGMQSCATHSLSSTMFQLDAPCPDHAPSMPSVSGIPDSSHHNIECSTSKNPEYSHQIGVDFTRDFKYIHMKQKATMSSHLACQQKLNVELADRSLNGELNKTKLESPLAYELKNIVESSSRTVVADDQRSEQEA